MWQLIIRSETDKINLKLSFFGTSLRLTGALEYLFIFVAFSIQSTWRTSYYLAWRYRIQKRPRRSIQIR